MLICHLCSLSLGRLKIERANVYFGYRPVSGSERVYKIELNGDIRAAKVILRSTLLAARRALASAVLCNTGRPCSALAHVSER